MRKLKVINYSDHSKFLLLVQTAVIIKDIQTQQQKSVLTLATAMDIDSLCLADYAEDMPSMADYVTQFVNWQYGERDRPCWIEFDNGPHVNVPQTP